MGTLVLNNRKRVKYKEFGAKKSPIILFLPGGGEPLKAYSAFMESLSKNGFRIFALDLIGYVEYSKKIISLEEWANLVDDFAKKIIRQKKFIILAQSMGTMVAAQYFCFHKNTNCTAAIFFAPGLVHNKLQYLIMRTMHLSLRLTHLLPAGMRWMDDKISFKSGCDLLDEYQKINCSPAICYVLVGRIDPYQILHILTGFKRIRPNKIIYKWNWDHSPQKRKMVGLISSIKNIAQT